MFYDWSNRGSFHFSLYRKADLAEELSNLDFTTPEELLYAWNLNCPSEVGLFPTHPKVISLKAPQSRQSNLERFLSGFKLDLDPFFQLEPSQREIPVNTSFVPRE